MCPKMQPARSSGSQSRSLGKRASSKKADARKRVAKADRPGRICPACGGVQPGAQKRAKTHMPTGLRTRQGVARAAAARATDGEERSATADVTSAPAREPVDAPTLVKGIVERLPAALGERHDDSPASAAQFTAAVRKAVLEEFRTRAAFAGRLAEIDALLWTQTDHGGPAVRTAMADHLSALGIRRLETPANADAFVVTEGVGEAFELLSPAYVDDLTGKVILAGQLRRIAADAAQNHTGEEA